MGRNPALTIEQNEHVLMASREGGSLFYGLLFIILNYIYMGALKSFKCLGAIWVLIRPWPPWAPGMLSTYWF